MTLQVAVAQFAPQKAEIERNLDSIAAIVRQACGEGADLVVLPEACTSGYFLEGGVLESSLATEELVAALGGRLAGGLDRPVDVVLGFYQRDAGILYNAAAYLEAGPDGVSARCVYHKFFLPTYGVFDEERFVARGRDLAVFDTRLGRVAILICEDVWHGVLPTLCAVRGAQMLIVPSASPARGFTGHGVDNHDRYRRLFRAVSEEHGVFCVNAQLCGFEGGKGLIGGSVITDPFGRTVLEGPLADEALLVVEIDMDLVSIARAGAPLVADLQSAWDDVRRLVEDTRI